MDDTYSAAFGETGPAAPEIASGAPEGAPEDPRTFLTFRIGGQTFALPVAPVREILDEQPVASLPETPPDVLGLIDVRGEGVMVVDIAHRLGVRSQREADRRIVVLERAGAGARPLGVFADQVLSVVELGGDEIEPAPAADRAGRAILNGVARLNGDLVLVLDHGALLGASSDDPFDFAG